MAGKTAAGVGNFFKRLFFLLLGMGFLLAVLSLFHGDPFAVATWFWNLCTSVVFHFRDWLLSIPSFRQLFKG